MPRNNGNTVKVKGNRRPQNSKTDREIRNIERLLEIATEPVYIPKPINVKGW